MEATCAPGSDAKAGSLVRAHVPPGRDVAGPHSHSLVREADEKRVEKPRAPQPLRGHPEWGPAMPSCPGAVRMA